MNTQTELKEKKISMNLPHQAKPVDRENRVGDAIEAGVNPAFWGTVGKYALKGLKGMLS